MSFAPQPDSSWIDPLLEFADTGEFPIATGAAQFDDGTQTTQFNPFFRIDSRVLWWDSLIADPDPAAQREITKILYRIVAKGGATRPLLQHIQTLTGEIEIVRGALYFNAETKSQVIKTFYDKTGCPVMINTSFNVRSEPIDPPPQSITSQNPKHQANWNKQ